jgi:hypothetical protein
MLQWNTLKYSEFSNQRNREENFCVMGRSYLAGAIYSSAWVCARKKTTRTYKQQLHLHKNYDYRPAIFLSINT